MAVDNTMREIVNTISAITGAENPGEKRTLPSYRLDKSVTNRVKILTLDIETTPHAAYTWGTFKQNIALNQIIEPGRMFCVVAKWYDKKTPIFLSDFHDGHQAMVEKIWELVNEADIVISFNGKSFDMKHLNTEFFKAGLGPVSPYKNIDLLLAARSQFRFASNKLDYLAGQVGIGSKTPHTGMPLWIDCMRGDEKAWALMKRYNIQDVKLTEHLYDILRPWIPNHPHLSMFTTEEWACSNCGHVIVAEDRKGSTHANVSSYPMYQCPECTHWVRGTRKLINTIGTRSARPS